MHGSRVGAAAGLASDSRAHRQGFRSDVEADLAALRSPFLPAGSRALGGACLAAR